MNRLVYTVLIRLGILDTFRAGMNLSQIRIAYSPENEVLEDVVRSSVAMMLTRNIQGLFYIVAEMFPDLIANIPPELISADLAYELLKVVARVEGYNSSADLRRIYYDEVETRRVLAAIQFPDYLSGMSLPVAPCRKFFPINYLVRTLRC